MARVDVFHGGNGVGRGRRRYLTIVEKNERRCVQKGMGWEGRVGAGKWGGRSARCCRDEGRERGGWEVARRKRSREGN
jgi:hypothetical protein